MKIGVFYLARAAEGLEPFRKFKASYGRYPAGISHDLVVIYKGFQSDEDFAAARAVFANIRHISVELSDTGFDIGSYLAAATRIDHDVVCCLNTFSEVLTPSWLEMLVRPLADPLVGITGATASYESLHDSLKLLNQMIWLCAGNMIRFDSHLAASYRFLLNLHAPLWVAKLDKPVSLKRRIKRLFHGAELPIEKLDERWMHESQVSDFLRRATGFPHFPNPHVRSNGFAVRRHDLLASSLEIIDKLDACEFESGHGSLTATILRSGRRALVVNRWGQQFDVATWPKSRTFRLGKQDGLLISDGRTRDFDRMSPRERAVHVAMSWGEHRARAPLLGCSFRVDEGLLAKSTEGKVT